MSVALAGAAMGLLGSAHCLGMCGGIAAALSVAPAAPGDNAAGQRAPASPRSSLRRPLAYNLGRVGSYATMGLLAGAFGSALAGLGGSSGLFVLRSLAALIIVAAGLYLAGWSGALVRLERLGGTWWRQHVAPRARGLRGSTSPLAHLALGALWGWLPCGLVYSALALAATSGSAASGAATMLAFGLGTLPATMAMGMAAEGGTSLLRGPAARRMAGAMVVVFGVWTFAASASVYSAAPPSGDSVACHDADAH